MDRHLQICNAIIISDFLTPHIRQSSVVLPSWVVLETNFQHDILYSSWQTYQGIRSEPVGQHHSLPVLVKLVVVLLGLAGVGAEAESVRPGLRPELRTNISLGDGR